MSFGVSTHDARLDGGRLGALEPEEIDWTAYLGWTGNKSPAFAGRTFLGRPYLYAHGEGSEANKKLAALARIAPLQQADKGRQEAIGDDGFELGREDGGAFADHVRNCILVGDLSLSSDLAYAFLEVEAGTKISPEYWTGWSTAIYNAIVADLRGGGFKLAQPLLPCICCAFKDDGAGSFVASQDVVDCLDAAGEKLAAHQTRCFGFWAVAPDVAANHAVEPNLDWSRLKPHSQTQGSSKQPVWIHVWRYMDEQEAGIPEVGKFALDATFVPQSGVDGVFNRMLTVNAWAASARPQRLGVDKGRDVSAEIACLAKTTATINRLPEGSAQAAPGPAINPPLTHKITFAVRYYSTPRTQPNKRAKDVSAAEARVISRVGAEVAAVWQAAVDFDEIPNYLTTGGNGIEDARNAFAYAKRIGQPPYTPVYFAVDGNFPDAAVVEPYFVEVAAGYDQYLLDQDLAGAKRVPYYIGAYASSNILERLYAKGLASHFWQTWPPPWGSFPPLPPPPPGVRPNERPFLHANMWQVCMENTAGLLASGIMGCWHASWVLGIATTVIGGTVSLTIDGVPTVPAALNFDATRQQIEQAIAQVAGIGAAGIRTDEWIQGGSRKIRLQFGKNVTVAGVHALVGPPPPPPLVTINAEFVDLNVAWGDVGGWQLK